MARMGFSRAAVNVIGRAGRDADMREVRDGLKVANFSIAVSDRDKNGEEDTTWFDVAVFGETAVKCAEQVRKGDMVHVEGGLKLDTFTTKDGTEATRIKVSADYVTFLTWRKGGDAKSSDVPNDLPWE